MKKTITEKVSMLRVIRKSPLEDGKVIRRIEGVVGKGNFFQDLEHRIAYSYDALNQQVLPGAVVFPHSQQEISDLLKIAFEEEIPVIPRGAGSGRAGGSVPVANGMVLSLERMNTIHKIDLENLTAEVEPGVVTGRLQKAVEEMKLFYPPDPSSCEFCTLGGNIATNAGGLRTVKYGVTRDYVLRLEAVLADGQLLHTGRDTRKNVAGYDLTRLLVGSEGTLAVVTRIVVKLLPLPEEKRTLLAFFPEVLNAGEAVMKIFLSGLLPASIEILDSSSLRVLAEAGWDFPGGRAGAMLILESDGSDLSVVREVERIREIFFKHGASEIRIAGNQAEAEEFWKARRLLSPALGRRYPHRISEDVTVPLNRIAALFEVTGRICQKYEVESASFGHAGDGNIHINVLFDAANLEESQRAGGAVEEILKAVVAMGGSISGEHGIGIAKRAYLGLQVMEPALGLMRKIKKVFDPRGILNPGKVLP